MTRRRMYFCCLGAYLTGWPIVQLFYNRVIMRNRDSRWTEEKVNIAKRVADEHERRLGGYDRWRRYPYRDENGYTIIGPECFASPGGDVISWRGDNYVPQASG